MKRMIRLAVLVAPLAFAAPAAAQIVPPPAREVDLSGPRFGLTVLDTGMVQTIKDKTGEDVSRAISQFGWQFERRRCNDSPRRQNDEIRL